MRQVLLGTVVFLKIEDVEQGEKMVQVNFTMLD